MFEHVGVKSLDVSVPLPDLKENYKLQTDHQTTTGFGPFKLSTCSCLQKGLGNSQNGVVSGLGFPVMQSCFA